MKRRPPPLTTRQADLAQTLHEALRLHRLGILDHAEQHYRAVLAVRPHHFDAQHLLGVLCLQLGRTDEALVLIRAALKLNPRSTVALSNFGLALRKAGRSQEALASFGKALAITPGDPELLANSGSVLLELGRPEEALASYDRAIATLPGNAGLHNDRGNTLHKLGRYEEALVSYNKALEIQPNHYEALNNRGNVLAELGFIDKALDSYEESNRIAPGNADIFNNRGNVLRKLERHQEALALYQRALSINPDHPVALYNCGAAQLALNRPEEALPPLQKALRIRPDYGDVHVALATTFLALRRPDKALESVNLALQTKPGDADVLNKRGIALEDLNRPEEALADYDKALAIKPDFAAALHNRGNALKSLKRPDEALISYKRAIAIQPDDIKTLTSLVFLQSQNCEWNDLDSIRRSVLLSLQLATFDSSPFPVLSMFDDPVVQRDASKQYVQKCKIQAGPPLWRAHSQRLKIRLAYLSADFKAHAVSYLIPELIELHDRSKFDVYGFFVGQNDGSPTARRLERAFDEFVEASALSDLSLAQRISDADVDILIDLGGHTKDSRILALSHRPAPIQVTYLGYPATTGASFIDYAIVDSYVVPQTFAEYFTENLAYLPDCFQCNDRRRRISEAVPIRSECGLPSDAFVFCSVNNGFKLNPQVFDVWARILLA